MKYLQAVTNFIFVEDEPEESDIIFVPGNTSPLPSERAAGLYRDGFAPFILPSGRYQKALGYFPGPSLKQEQYYGSYETEWDFMRDVLLQNGVPDTAILKENMAQYTLRNAQLSKEVLELAHIKVHRAILCCNPYHARRCLMYYSMVFPNTKFLVCPAKDSPVTRDNWQESESGLKTVLGEVERCGRQFAFMLCGPQEGIFEP